MVARSRRGAAEAVVREAGEVFACVLRTSSTLLSRLIAFPSPRAIIVDKPQPVLRQAIDARAISQQRAAWLWFLRTGENPSGGRCHADLARL